MEKNTRRKAIVWSCIGVAVIAAVLLFLYLPRRADKLMKLAPEVTWLMLTDTYVTTEATSHFQNADYETADASLIAEARQLLSRTKLRFIRPTGGIKTYDNEAQDRLYILWVRGDAYNGQITFRPDGIVYCGNYSYRLLDKSLLADYMALFERIKEAAEEEERTNTDMTVDQLAFYQKLFDAPSWYAQAVISPFEDSSPSLGQMFYDGLSFGDDGALVYSSYVTPEDGDEWTWVRENVPGATEVDVARLPRDGMYQVLRDTIYGSAEMPEDLAPEGWTYWDKTDCWYHAHGDTGINSVTLLNGCLQGGSRGWFTFENAFGQECRVYFTLGRTEEDVGQLYLTSCICTA